MPKQKKTLLLYPVIVKDEEKYVGRKDYVATKAKEFKAKFKDLEIKPTDVSALLEMAEKGENLADDAHEAHREILNFLQADATKAKEHQAEETNKAATKKSHETQVLNAALEIDKVDRSVLDQKFNAGANYIEVSPDASDEEIAAKLSISLVMQDFSAWAIGDLGNALQDRGLDSVISNLCAQTGRAESTVYGNMKIARDVPKESRKLNVLPTVYKEIFLPKLADKPKKDAEIKAKLIAEAEKSNWDSKEARSHVNASRSKKAGKQGGKTSTPKANYLVLKQNEKPYLVEDEPGFEDSVIVIDLKKKLLLDVVEKDGKEIVDWVGLEVK